MNKEQIKSKTLCVMFILVDKMRLYHNHIMSSSIYHILFDVKIFYLSTPSTIQFEGILAWKKSKLIWDIRMKNVLSLRFDSVVIVRMRLMESIRGINRLSWKIYIIMSHIIHMSTHKKQIEVKHDRTTNKNHWRSKKNHKIPAKKSNKNLELFSLH